MARISDHAYKMLVSRKLGAYFGDVSLAFDIYGRNFAAIRGFVQQGGSEYTCALPRNRP